MRTILALLTIFILIVSILPIQQADTFEFNITGGWDEQKVPEILLTEIDYVQGCAHFVVMTPVFNTQEYKALMALTEINSTTADYTLISIITIITDHWEYIDICSSQKFNGAYVFIDEYKEKAEAEPAIVWAEVYEKEWIFDVIIFAKNADGMKVNLVIEYENYGIKQQVGISNEYKEYVNGYPDNFQYSYLGLGKYVSHNVWLSS